MGMRSYMKKLMGRVGGASRSKRGACSHVNTKRNKRAASKAGRCSYRACLKNGDCDITGCQAGRSYGPDSVSLVDRMMFEDHHLDIPDEIKGDR